MSLTWFRNRKMTANVHNLVHLGKICRMFGPLWCYSCFPFESCNKELLSFIHGTSQIGLRYVHNLSPRLYHFISAMQNFSAKQQLGVLEELLVNSTVQAVLCKLGSRKFVASSNWVTINKEANSKSFDCW